MSAALLPLLATFVGSLTTHLYHAKTLLYCTIGHRSLPGTDFPTAFIVLCHNQRPRRGRHEKRHVEG